jgi:hypothetical protein
MSQHLSVSPPVERSGPSRPAQEETLIVDVRGSLTPSQLVERKLMGALRGGPLPVSHLLNAVRNRRPAV